jgi:hypothetical protein
MSWPHQVTPTRSRSVDVVHDDRGQGHDLTAGGGVDAAPIGAALVAEIERRATGHASAPGAPDLREEEARSTVAWLEAAPRPVFLDMALTAAERVGPWTNGSAAAAVEAYSRARARPDLVIAVADRLAAECVVPVVVGSQELVDGKP